MSRQSQLSSKQKNISPEISEELRMLNALANRQTTVEAATKTASR